jgi:hypothetical protein
MAQSLLLAFLRELVVEDLDVGLQRATYTHKTAAEAQVTRKSQSTPIGLCTPLALVATDTQSSLEQWWHKIL